MQGQFTCMDLADLGLAVRNKLSFVHPISRGERGPIWHGRQSPGSSAAFLALSAQQLNLPLSAVHARVFSRPY